MSIDTGPCGGNDDEMNRFAGAGALTLGLVVLSATPAAASAAHAPAATISSVTYLMKGFANLARDVPKYQLGRVYLDGSGTVGGGATGAGTRTQNIYLHYPEANMSTEVIGWKYSATPHELTQKLVLTVKVVSSDDEVDCKVGTVGEVTLIDDNRKMKNGQRRDSITQIYPVGGCPSFIQGVSNRDAGHLQPTTGGRGGGQYADVAISTN
jgi:hypothetical protein